ncbi:MAG: EI24 domain-containing protein, partial [Rhodospirillaceae bacterium]|nr:EI24 domain-containing protein [Rhodospirillaceae bacterium]
SLIDYLHSLFSEYDGFARSGSILSALGLATLKTVVVPLLAMLALLPLMIVTALMFIGVVAMPLIVRHVGRRHFPALELRRGGSVLGSIGMALGGMLIFLLLWLLTLPLYAFAPLAVLAQALLWGWLTCRADYASADERRAILRLHRGRLLLIGVVCGTASALPGALWLGGGMALLALPLLAAAAIWLYVLMFIFTGLWFTYYCLQALAQLRTAAPAVTLE